MTKSRYFSRSLLFLILLLLVSGAMQCCPFYYVPPPTSCPIEGFLVTKEDLPGDGWAVSVLPENSSPPRKIGIQRIGTIIRRPQTEDRMGNDIYRMRRSFEGHWRFRDEVGSYSRLGHFATDWYYPEELTSLGISADQFWVGCNIHVIFNINIEDCRFVARYQNYLVFFRIRMEDLEYAEVARIINKIDNRFVTCLPSNTSR